MEFILPNDGVNRPESQFQEIFDNSSEILNESVKISLMAHQ